MNNKISKEDFLDTILSMLDTGNYKDVIMDRYCLEDILPSEESIDTRYFDNIYPLEEIDFLNKPIEKSNYLRYCSVYEIVSKLSTYKELESNLFSMNISYIDEVIKNVVFCFNQFNNFYYNLSKENNLEIKFINTNLDLEKIIKGFNLFYFIKYISCVWVGYMYNSFIFLKKTDTLFYKLNFIEHCLIAYFSLFYKENKYIVDNNSRIYLNYDVFINASDYVIKESLSNYNSIDTICSINRVKSSIMNYNIERSLAIGLRYEIDNLLFVDLEENDEDVFVFIRQSLKGFVV